MLPYCGRADTHRRTESITPGTRATVRGDEWIVAGCDAAYRLRDCTAHGLWTRQRRRGSDAAHAVRQIAASATQRTDQRPQPAAMAVAGEPAATRRRTVRQPLDRSGRRHSAAALSDRARPGDAATCTPAAADRGRSRSRQDHPGGRPAAAALSRHRGLPSPDPHTRRRERAVATGTGSPLRTAVDCGGCRVADGAYPGPSFRTSIHGHCRASTSPHSTW